MGQVVSVFQPGTQLAATATVLYTQPSNSYGQIVRAVVYNTDTVPRQITIYRVPSGGSPGTTNIVISGTGGRVMVGQDMSLSSLAGMVLNPGDTIQGLADSASKVNFFMSGYLS